MLSRENRRELEHELARIESGERTNMTGTDWMPMDMTRALALALDEKNLKDQAEKYAATYTTPVRRRVYDVISGERDYQEAKWGHEGHQSLGAYLTFMRVYLAKAEAAATGVDKHAAMHAVRKVAALGVACMEDHGALSRTSEG